MLSAKVTDSYLAGIVQRICCSIEADSLSGGTRKCAHSMSRVRELVTYPERFFGYRVSKLDEYQKIALEELCKKVARCKREPPTESAASGATGASAAEQRGRDGHVGR